ncbi:MoaD/ThiS family protein [Chloroflexota bacterium]
MKITTKFSFNPREEHLETQSTTLGGLLDELSHKYSVKEVEFFDNDRGEICFDCDVILNGQSFQILPDGLDTKLRDSDRVEIIKLSILQGG